jgi:hypothetical protein
MFSERKIGFLKSTLNDIKRWQTKLRLILPQHTIILFNMGAQL